MNPLVGICGLVSGIVALITGVFYVVRAAQRQSERIQSLEATIATLNQQIAALQSRDWAAMRSYWLAEVPRFTYDTEAEVEMKFIGPLLQYLGHSPHNIKLRVHVAIQVGRQKNTGQADWVVYTQGRPFAVIEAKRPSEPLDDAVKAQVRSYAFALGAPVYVMTNGERLQVYERGIQDDILKVYVGMKNLENAWESLKTNLEPR